MPRSGSLLALHAGTAPQRSRGAVFIALLLVLCIIPSVSYTLTLERPNVNVDWDKVPQQKQPSRKDAQNPPNRLFGTVEFRGAIKNLPQWERVLRMYKARKTIDEDFARANRKNETQLWARIKAEAPKRTPLQNLQEVNKFFNLWPYRTDMDLYGLVDYWATPAEFISKSGDCEDYAITKMFALIQLGFKAENMRVVVVRDRIRNIEHAVLAVYLADDVYILDNASTMVVSHNKIGHYQPIVSMNLAYQWKHVPPKQ